MAQWSGWRVWVGMVLALGVVLPSHARAETAPPTPVAIVQANSESAHEIIARVRPAIIQIRGFLGKNTAQAFHGTGFAVAQNGVFVTNYHVVAEYLMSPKKFRLEFKHPDGATGKIFVLAVDVHHDLALVRADGYEAAPLDIEGKTAAKGSRAFAVGYPLDVGLTITEGVSNGKVEESFEPRIHYSGAINAGMSGGPAFNSDGKVIGVNVSGYRFEQLVSFLVPAEHVRALLDHTPNRDSEPQGLADDVAQQLRTHSAELLGAMAATFPTQTSAGYQLPGKLAPFVDCNATGNPSAADPVTTEKISCSAKAGLYVQQGFSTGDIRYEHYVLSTAKLGAWRFANRLSMLSVAQGTWGQPKYVAPFACHDGATRLAGFDARLLICSRAYRKFDGLYDFVVRVISLDGNSQGFVSHLDMFGVEFDPGLALIRRYVSAMERRS